MEMKTPYFLISKEKLQNNINDFINALELLWPNSYLSYSVKTNSLPWILQYLNDNGLFAEVVSYEEYQLALKCGFSDDAIVFNGPIKTEEAFKQAIRSGSIVNIDSKRELEWIKNIQVKDGIHNVGLRINPDPVIFEENDIEYTSDGFRFGFSEANNELADAINILRKQNIKIGLHLHCNSITRSKNVYVALAKYAASVIKKYDLDVTYIDVGGGFFGGVPGKTTPYEYIDAIKNELINTVDINRTKLILEPGSAIIGSVVDLVTSVLDIKNTTKSRIVTTDGSRIHIDPLWIKKGYMYSLKTKSKAIHPKQIICGYTCMDHDRLMIIEGKEELNPGDIITYHRVGAYSMTFGGMFIRYFPDVYVDEIGEYTLVRNRISVDDYFNIHSCEEK